MKRIILIGGSRQQQKQPAPARDLYTGDLFRARLNYAQHGNRVFLLSAKHGLINPDAVIDPYDLNLADIGGYRRATWSIDVARQLTMFLHWPLDPKTVVEIHAGRFYADQVAAILSAIGVTVVRPLKSLTRQQQLFFFDHWSSLHRYMIGFSKAVLQLRASRELNGAAPNSASKKTSESLIRCQINGQSIDVPDLKPKAGESDRDWIKRVADTCRVSGFYVFERTTPDQPSRVQSC